MYPPFKRPPPTTPRTPAATHRSKRMNTDSNSESLQVFCRLRPTEDVSCLQVLSDTTIKLTLPKSSVNFRPGACKEYQYSFKRVFTEANTQKEVFNIVARPLVENLIRGQDGLLFTYGVTGSGKTHTMSGHKNDVGILPRCLDVLFHTIYDYQAKKYVFKPDGMNGFDLQSDADAVMEQEKVLKLKNTNPKNNKLMKNQSNENLTDIRNKDESKLSMVEEDNAYSVFVTYIEIYNDYVNDLLKNFNDENDTSSKLPSIVEEVGSRKTYVRGVTKVEVKSADEAYEVFREGQTHRRVEHTNLNKESSRSHSIFTIHLVQAPLDVAGENVLQDKKAISISQLSLVDLAGIERTKRTNNCGQRLKEAGSINNSLMTLRICLEILRENQQTGSGKRIPCRDNMFTNLFKHFFRGEGDIRMIVCASPGIADHDETIQVLKFAEISQEILVKSTLAKPDAFKVGLTPGRRHQAHQKKLAMEERPEREPLPYVPNDVGAIYNLESFPSAEDFDPLDLEANTKLMKYLENRIQKKRTLTADFENRCAKFRADLLEREENTLHLQQEYNTLNALHERDLMKTRALEEKVSSLDANSSNMKRRCKHFEDDIKSLKRKLEEKDMIIARILHDNDRRKRVHKKMTAKVDQLSKEKENEFKDKQQIQLRMEDTDKRLFRVKNALAPHNENLPTPRKVAKYNELNTESELVTSSIPEPDEWISVETTHVIPTRSVVSPTKSIAVSNARYGRTHYGPNDEWLDHRVTISAPLNTVMQPVMKRRRSFSNATNPKEITKTSKYCLMTQDQDGDGTLETQLYKGDVVRTCGGGAQIILNDVETLRQTSPLASPVISPVTSPRRVTLLKSATAAIAASSSSAKYPDIPSTEGGLYRSK